MVDVCLAAEVSVQRTVVARQRTIIVAEDVRAAVEDVPVVAESVMVHVAVAVIIHQLPTNSYIFRPYVNIGHT